MILIRKFIIVILLLLSNVIFAQQKSVKSFHLNWNDNKEIKINAHTTIKSSVVENQLIDVNNLPVFNKMWSVKSSKKLISYKALNVKTEIISWQNFPNLKKASLKNKLSVSLHFVNARNKRFAVLTSNPLFLENGILKKVTDFSIEVVSVNSGLQLKRNSSVKNSVLSSGTWYKFAVDTTGVFKIDKSFLEKLGVNINDINPKHIQIYGNGGQQLSYLNSDFRYDGLQENSIFVEGEDDLKFDTNDYILFYAKGPDAWLRTGILNNENLHHQHNIYTDKAYYFLTIGNSNGKRIQIQPSISNSPTQTISSYNDYTFFEKDEVNLYAAGQQWFGDSFILNDSYQYHIPFDKIDNSSPILVRVRAVAESGLPSTFNVLVNNNPLFDINIPQNGGLTNAYAIENSGNVTLTGNQVNITVNYNNGGNPSAKAYLDYIEILGKKQLLAEGKQFGFRNFDVINNSGVYEFIVKNKANIASIWNVTDYINPTIIQNESNSNDYSFKVNGGVNHEFRVLNESDYYEPEILENSLVDNQNLHSLNNIDYLVITNKNLASEAQRLADYHKRESNLKTKVVLLNQIYNEFGSGAADITAIRDFIKHLYTNATTNQLKYVCLFGDASYDYKDRISGNNNIVPTFEAFQSFNLATSYVTDDFYGMMDDNEGVLQTFERQDVATGRIPVTDVIQAKAVVDKILNYSSSKAFGNWRNRIALVADDIDAAGEQTIETNLEALAQDIETYKPAFNLKKIYVDAYQQESSAGGNRYPTVNTEINNQIEKGTLVMDYFGHGGEDGWAAERILEVSDIQSWKNRYQLPLFVTVTCEFSRFDNPLRNTAGEYVLWNTNGGAASLISTTREIFISVGEALNRAFIGPLLQFKNEQFTIAENLMNAKNTFSTSQRFFIFNFGDPAMILKVPKPNIKITKMNGVDLAQSIDTIKALSKIKFEGEVTQENGTLFSDFNGEIQTEIYDKAVSKSTLDNDNHNFIMNFNTIESKIFSGRASVQNGLFSFEFVAPKDLKIAYGKGKISLYAFNNNVDKGGANFDITVGGVNLNAPEDNTGPQISLYMNDLSFIDGGTTNQSPLFIAVLEDENGINTSLTAVDHDIVAVLDGNESNPIVLNDYYQTELDNYKKGQVNYPFKDLSPGLHTLTLKVWDTYNNMSEATFTFFVVSDSNLVLNHVLNYPNPFINYTEFWFNHNKPNETLEVMVQIYTVSGKLVKTLRKTIINSGSLSRDITWNGLDDFGQKIGKGVYVYKLKVKDLVTNQTAQKIEKLVILQ
ncbi:MAG: type IX secretion system sortase PorU [Lutibacter sp.]